MSKEHIAWIFKAIDHGLTCLTEVDDSHGFESVSNVSPRSTNPETFNRMSINIDGEKYTVSIFRNPASAHVLNIGKPHKYIGPGAPRDADWAIQDGVIYGWSESNCQYEKAWWLDDKGFPTSQSSPLVQSLVRDRPFNPEWLDEEKSSDN